MASDWQGLRGAQILAVFLAALAGCGTDADQTTEQEAGVSNEVTAQAVAAQIQDGCDQAISEMMEELELESRELLDLASKAAGIGPRDPFVEVDGSSITINDAHACTERTEDNAVYEAMQEEFGFSPAVISRIKNTRPIDGQLEAESDAWRAYWSDDLTNGQDIIIEPLEPEAAGS